MYPVLRAVAALGGSASSREITDKVIEMEGFTDEQISQTYGTREKSVLVDRIEWARSYCKLSGALESPSRKLYLLTALGHETLALPESEARAQLMLLDRSVRSSSSRKLKRPDEPLSPGPVESETNASELSIDPDEDTAWTKHLLGRLHRMSPEGFEEFCLYLLRLFGLELTRRGGTGDEGIDGIGTAPLTP